MVVSQEETHHLLYFKWKAVLFYTAGLDAFLLWIPTRSWNTWLLSNWKKKNPPLFAFCPLPYISLCCLTNAHVCLCLPSSLLLPSASPPRLKCRSPGGFNTRTILLETHSFCTAECRDFFFGLSFNTYIKPSWQRDAPAVPVHGRAKPTEWILEAL